MNHYELLGVSRTASKNQIKKSYKKLALKYHPDKNLSNKQQAKQKFTKISQAYAVLSDPVKRQHYDDSLLNKTNLSGQEYKWKNPEFDPSYNHFPNSSYKHASKASEGSFNLFEKFDMNPRFPLFKKNFMDVEFGGFTFEMAEEIFKQAFSEMNNNPELEDLMRPANYLSNTESYPFKNQSTKKYSESHSYKPKDSSLLSERTIQRNGKKVLVKKYSITENGLTRTETHEEIIH